MPLYEVNLSITYEDSVLVAAESAEQACEVARQVWDEFGSESTWTRTEATEVEPDETTTEDVIVAEDGSYMILHDYLTKDSPGTKAYQERAEKAGQLRLVKGGK